jgi:hypothetical protein
MASSREMADVGMTIAFWPGRGSGSLKFAEIRLPGVGEVERGDPRTRA